MSECIFVIDPFLREPASDALNNLNFLLSQAVKQIGTPAHIEIFFPMQGKYSLREQFKYRNKKLGNIRGVVSLGSYSHITEKNTWVKELGDDLRDTVIEKGIPFFGICFSHQLFADIYGASVDFIDNRDTLPDKKYDEFREIRTTSQYPESFLGGKKRLLSKSRHEQEVKTIPENMDLIFTSEACPIEGLKHKEFPAFSVQSHPEEYHESLEGWNFVQSVLRFFLIHRGKY